MATLFVPGNATTTAYASSLVASTAPARLLRITGYTTTAQFLQVHDAASLPADAAVPVFMAAIAATSNFSFVWEPGRTFATGIVVCNSTTGPTKTLGSANCWFDVQYQ